jgi:hypothetical protein
LLSEPLNAELESQPSGMGRDPADPGIVAHGPR